MIGSVLVPRLLSGVLRTIYPQTCAACDAPATGVANTGLCELCMQSCLAIGIACPRCARPIDGPRAITCARCSKTRGALRTCTACYEYGGQLAVALRRLKFSGRNDIARSLGPLLHERFMEVSVTCDVGIAMPLHSSRLAKRGFNQAQRILVPLAAHCDLPVLRTVLTRIRPTSPQSRLSRAQRAANLKGAFRATSKVAGKRILLLDDIRTTGATLGEAAKALRKAGAREIHGFVVARTEWEG